MAENQLAVDFYAILVLTCSSSCALASTYLFLPFLFPLCPTGWVRDGQGHGHGGGRRER